MARWLPPMDAGPRVLLPLAAYTLLLCGARVVDANQVARYGDPSFWTKLGDLRASAGSLSPDFTPDATDYTLRIASEAHRSVTFTIEIDMAKYDTMQLPRVEVNGEEYRYDPLTTNEYLVNLSASIGPYDEVLRITVKDPTSATSQGWWSFSGTRATTYSVRVMQPPEVEKVTKPLGISVTLPGGQVVMPSPAYDPASPPAKIYEFLLTDEHGMHSDVVDVTLLCSQFATSMAFNGREVDMNSTRRIVAASAFTRVNVECKYDDAMWVSGESADPIQLVFRHVLDLSKLSVSLMVSQEEGYCTLRSLDVATNGSNTNTEGFVCRMHDPEPKFIVIYSDHRVEAHLLADGGVSYPMRTGQPRQISVPEGRSLFTMQIVGAREPTNYPVEVIRVAPCTSLTCPVSLYPRPEIRLSQAAKARLCLAERCNDGDVERCCASAARCSNLLVCPEGRALRQDAAQVYCTTAQCSTEADGATCCGEPTACAGHPEVCSAGMGLKPNADQLFCRTTACGPEDSAVCCEPRASCEKFHFACPGSDDPVNKTDTMDKSKYWCKGSTCTREDEDRCCDRDLAKQREEDERRRRKKSEEEERRRREREWAAKFETIGCSPSPKETCYHQRCFYDETCLEIPPRYGGLGCYAGGIDPRCRFCGFMQYRECPTDSSCFDGLCETWPEEKLQRCYKNYNVDCPQRKWSEQPWLIMKSAAKPAGADRAGRGGHHWAFLASCAVAIAGVTAVTLVVRGGTCSRRDRQGSSGRSSATAMRPIREVASGSAEEPLYSVDEEQAAMYVFQ